MEADNDSMSVPSRPGRPSVPQTPNLTVDTSHSPQPIPPKTFPTPTTNYAVPGGYTRSNNISVEDLLTGNPAKWKHLDTRVEEVVNLVQKDLVDSGDAQLLTTARTVEADRIKLASVVDRLALTHLIGGRGSSHIDQPYILASVTNEIVGLGPLEPLWQDPNITEVIVNGPNQCYVERFGKLQKATGVRFRNQAHLLDVCQRIVSPINRKLDVKSPLVDGRLPDGSRVNVAHYAIAPKGPLLTIRRFPEVNRSIADLVALGSFSEDMARTLVWLISSKASSLVVGGTGTGKLLALNTPIPTPDGWSTMGTLKISDQVIGRDGQACNVTFLSDIEKTPTMYRLTLSDGQEIVACADHQWVVNDFNDRRQLRLGKKKAASLTQNQKLVDLPKIMTPIGETVADDESIGSDEQVLTTQQMVDAEVHLDQEHPNFAIRVTQPYNTEYKDLPCDPYVFGAWLGDDHAESDVSTSIENILEEKRIPAAYLRASVSQRLSLLQGLMDTGGSVASNGTCQISQNSRKLAYDVLELIRSLGIVTRINIEHSTDKVVDKKTGNQYHKVIENQYRMVFTTNLPVFRLPHKLDKISNQGGKPQQWVYIVDIQPETTVPGRCIQVDSPDSTYLIQGFIPTHNTTLLNALSSAIPREERVITIEDSLELRLSPYAHVAAMEGRPADASGENAVSIRALVKNALRQRPDRIIVGEVRDESALEMLQACNTGHEGSMSTVHANGPNEAVARLSVMVAQGGEFPSDKVDWLVGSAIDLIVMVKRYRDGSRRVSGLYEVPELDVLSGSGGLRTVPLWEWERTGEDAKGRLLGKYVKREELSEHLRFKLSLDFEPYPSWADVVALAEK